jgi:hypothetical protein
MKLKRRDLNRLIESLLNEVGPGVGMDPTGATMPQGMKRSEYKQLEDASISKDMAILFAEIAVGFTPAGVVLDVRDISRATKIIIDSEGDDGKAEMSLAAAGLFLPGVGDAIAKGIRRILKKGKTAADVTGLSAKELAKMDPREVDDLMDLAADQAKKDIELKNPNSKTVSMKDAAEMKKNKSVNVASGKSTYLDELPAEEIQDKLSELPISVKEYMDVRLTKTKTMNGVSKSGNRIFNDTVPLQATAFEDMMDAYGKIPNKGKVNVGFKPLPKGAPSSGSARIVDTKPGFNLAPGDEVMVAGGKYVHHEIVGITTDGKRFGLLLKGGSKAGESAGKLSLVSNETASDILSRYPGLVDEIVAKIIE